VYFNEKGQTSHLVMNHRPASAMLFSQLLDQHFGADDDYDQSIFCHDDLSGRFLDHGLSRGQWPPAPPS
jgi:hypothetical protein